MSTSPSGMGQSPSLSSHPKPPPLFVLAALSWEKATKGYVRTSFPTLAEAIWHRCHGLMVYPPKNFKVLGLLSCGATAVIFKVTSQPNMAACTPASTPILSISVVGGREKVQHSSQHHPHSHQFGVFLRLLHNNFACRIQSPGLSSCSLAWRNLPVKPGETTVRPAVFAMTLISAWAFSALPRDLASDTGKGTALLPTGAG